MFHMICSILYATILKCNNFFSDCNFENTSFFLVYNIIMKSPLQPVTSRDKFYIQGSNLNRKMLFFVELI